MYDRHSCVCGDRFKWFDAPQMVAKHRGTPKGTFLLPDEIVIFHFDINADYLGSVIGKNALAANIMNYKKVCMYIVQNPSGDDFVSKKFWEQPPAPPKLKISEPVFITEGELNIDQCFDRLRKIVEELKEKYRHTKYILKSTQWECDGILDNARKTHRELQEALQKIPKKQEWKDMPDCEGWYWRHVEFYGSFLQRVIKINEKFFYGHTYYNTTEVEKPIEPNSIVKWLGPIERPKP